MFHDPGSSDSRIPLVPEENVSRTLEGLLEGAARSVLDLVLPIYCLGCGEPGDIICPPCVANLPRLEPPYCANCSDPGVSGVCDSCRRQRRFSTSDLLGIRSPYLMEGLLREAVLAFKYRNYRAGAPCLANLMAKYLMSDPIPGNTLVPVPLHPKKLRERGYNQAGLLAKEVGRVTGINVEDKLLVRIRNTPPQVLSGQRSQRRDNTAGAFSCPQDIEGLACILVDDVCTTGSTLGACAEALVAAGAESVWALTLARERMGSLQGET